MCVAKVVIDLKMIVQQNRSLVREVLELGNTLIFEVKAEHRWTIHALEVFGQLNRIMGNLVKLLEVTETKWDQSADLFACDEGRKLWTTAVALWRALPPIRAKYIEVLARRRRQRIMGSEIEEIEELDPETVAGQLQQVKDLHEQLAAIIQELQVWLDKLPDGLAPELTAQEAGQMVDAKENATEKPADDAGKPAGDAETGDAADKSEQADATAASAQTEQAAASAASADDQGAAPSSVAPAEPYSRPAADADELSPV